MPPRVIPYAIRFRCPIVTAEGPWVVRRGVWVVMEDGGFSGLGETPDLGPMRHPSLNGAIELARLDIEGKRIGRPIAALLAGDPPARIAVNALLFSIGVEESAVEASRMQERGFRTLKLKVAVAPPEMDIARIAEVRSRVGPEVRIRIDANCGWDERTAVEVLRKLEDFDVEYVEDPVPGDLRAVRSRVGIPVAADPRTSDRAREIVEEKGADFLILKPALLGGIRDTREIACRAIEEGIGVVITSLFETAVGVAAGVHLAASLPGRDRAHGLATVDLLEDHPVRGLDAPEDGYIRVPDRAGLGVDLEESQP